MAGEEHSGDRIHHETEIKGMERVERMGETEEREGEGGELRRACLLQGQGTVC